jgi:hypothetical protein
MEKDFAWVSANGEDRVMMLSLPFLSKHGPPEDCEDVASNHWPWDFAAYLQ